MGGVFSVKLSVRTALIILGSIGVVYGILAVLFGALSFYICCRVKKNREKVNPDAVNKSSKLRSSPDQDDSAYDTSTSSSMPSSSTSTDNSSHPLKPIKKRLMVSGHEPQGCCTDDSMSTGSPYPARNARNNPDNPRTEEAISYQDTEFGGEESRGKRGKPVKRSNSCLQSIQPEDSSEPFTVLTVHKSTLKRQKASRSNSQKPLMEGEGRTSDDDDVEAAEGKKTAEVHISEPSRKSKPSPSPRRVYLVGKSPDYPRPSPKKPARTNSTKPLMLYEDGDDTDEPTQEDFDNIQGVEETLPSRISERELSPPSNDTLTITPSTSRHSLAAATPPSSNRHSQATTPLNSRHSQATTPLNSRHSQATTPLNSRHSQANTPSTSRQIQLPSLCSPSRSSKAGTPSSSRRHSRRESLVLENLGVVMPSNTSADQGAEVSINIPTQGVDALTNTSTHQTTDPSVNISIEGADMLTNISTQGADTPTNMLTLGVATINELFQTSSSVGNGLILKNQRTTTPTPTRSRLNMETKRPRSAQHQMESLPQKSLNNLQSDLMEIITQM